MQEWVGVTNRPEQVYKLLLRFTRPPQHPFGCVGVVVATVVFYIPQHGGLWRACVGVGGSWHAVVAPHAFLAGSYTSHVRQSTRKYPVPKRQVGLRMPPKTSAIPKGFAEELRDQEGPARVPTRAGSSKTGRGPENPCKLHSLSACGPVGSAGALVELALVHQQGGFYLKAPPSKEFCFKSQQTGSGLSG